MLQLTPQFVQGLSSPFYLHTLATDGYFKDEAFLNYLAYLEYWREPDYVRFIVCVMGLLKIIANL